MDYGIGMGLSCSKEIAKAMGGDVTLISSAKGSTLFQIKLPVSFKNINNKDVNDL